MHGLVAVCASWRPLPAPARILLASRKWDFICLSAEFSNGTSSHGPMLIGLMFNFILLGIIMTQLYIYMKTYKRRDKLWMKTFVFMLVAANLANSIFIGIDMYVALINHFSTSRLPWLCGEY